MTDTDARRVDTAVLPRIVIHRWTPTQAGAVARRAVAQVDPDGGARRHEAAVNESNVTIDPDDHGMAELAARGDAVTITQLMTAINTHADTLATVAPGTTIGPRRLAALADLVLRDQFLLRDHILGHGNQPNETNHPDIQPPAKQHRRRRPEAIVSIDLDTILGLNVRAGELTGYGPIPAHLARLVAADSTLRRLVTDPITADTLDLGRHTYQPSQRLATLIRLQDQACQFPGCTRRVGLEIDHRHSWANNGNTNRDNLQLLCRLHHTLKTTGTWNSTRQPDGTTTWTKQDGTTATRNPCRREHEIVLPPPMPAVPPTHRINDDDSPNPPPDP